MGTRIRPQSGADHQRLRDRLRGRPLLALAMGLLATLGGAAYARQHARAGARAAFRQQAEALVDGVERKFDLALESLRAISALLRAHPGLNDDEFRRFARELMARHQSLAALEWAPLVADADRSTFEAERATELGRPFTIREPGASGGMVGAPRRDRYAPLALLEPFLLDLEGLDIRFEPTRRAAVDTAVASRGLFATAKFRLVEDPPNVYSVAVYDPVPSGGRETGAPPIAGVAIALFRLDPLVRSALAGVDLRTVDFALLDEDPALEQELRILFASRPGAEAPGGGHTVFTKTFRFVGRPWSVVCATPVVASWTAAVLVFGGGTTVSALVAWLLLAREGRRRLQTALRAERELGGYVLGRPLGEGGMGSVFEATHRLLRRRVAIKLVRPERSSPELRERFNREARTMADLSSPHTITLYDYGSADDGRLYVVMEYLDGLTLETLVVADGAQPPERVRHILLQACESLIEAHEAGIVHRDIKPANIMLCKLGGRHDFVKVLDFGLAKATLGGAETKVSRAGVVIGTFTHIAPECLSEPANASARSDLYSLGCVAYELLSGREVFSSADQTSLIAAHLTQVPAPLDHARVPEQLARVVMKCLEKDPNQRFQSARQLAHALIRAELPPWSETHAAEWWHTWRSRSEGGSSAPLTDAESR